jgi:Carboxypeptidase regulatory-like domain
VRFRWCSARSVEDSLPFTSFDSTWPDPITTDAEGQFRFAGLREGRYTIEVKAAGFKDGRVEKTPAGSENVVVKLSR